MQGWCGGVRSEVRVGGWCGKSDVVGWVMRVSCQSGGVGGAGWCARVMWRDGGLCSFAGVVCKGGVASWGEGQHDRVRGWWSWCGGVRVRVVCLAVWRGGGGRVKG